MRLLPVLFAVSFLAGPALAQTVTATVSGIVESKGTIRGQLCADMKSMMGGQCPLFVTAPAKAGSVDLVFPNVPAGTYVFQTFHDADDNGRLGIPAEGYAFSNNQPYPPTFDKAAIKVEGDTHIGVKLIHMVNPATQGAEQGLSPPNGVTKTDLRADGLYGALYSPAGAKTLPTIIAIGGSEGGLDTISAISQSWALHGYNVLALAYWRAPGLPQNLEGVPLEYFDKAVGWLKGQPQVDGARIGMMGWSRGGEGALLIASHNPEIRAVMALAPGSHVILGINQTDYSRSKPAWTLGGQPVPYFTPDFSIAMDKGFRAMMDESHRDVTKHPEAEIPVENINGPVLLLTGGQDGVWNSPAQAERVMARLKAKGFKPKAQHIVNPGAGHLVFTGDPALDVGAKQHQTFAGVMGGTAEANRAAWADSWSRALAFFDAALKPASKGGKP